MRLRNWVLKFSTPVFDGINNQELSDIMKEADMTVDGKTGTV